MATDTPSVALDRESPETIESTISGIRRMLLVGGLFVAVGYLLLVGALVVEVTQFHPLLEQFFASQTAHSVAGGGPDRAGEALLNSQLATINQFPSTLLWMKLGGVGHILVGIFLALAGVIRALSVMPHRLSYEMERTQG
jgi:hypothetical protein